MMLQFFCVATCQGYDGGENGGAFGPPKFLAWEQTCISICTPADCDPGRSWSREILQPNALLVFDLWRKILVS